MKENQNIDEVMLAQVIWLQSTCKLIHGLFGSHPPCAGQEGEALVGSVMIPVNTDIPLLYAN